MDKNIKIYETDTIKIFWQPKVCEHAAECVKGLPKVFDVNKRPWISPENAMPQEMMDVINRCPSKALTYENKNKTKERRK
ncbi:(4Fe-4S)-binding protein [Niallia sp. Krafla_26]|uniref:(4Fe-4S)-binding protein n=1 Tax=Niallia sp. Krafla_26 TaxID=3064703 RepID=UPI003D17C3FA